MTGQATAKPPVLVCESDAFGRITQLILDPRQDDARNHALADFFAHDVADFDTWCERVRANVGNLAPSDVRLVKTESELDAHLAEADALLVESLLSLIHI